MMKQAVIWTTAIAVSVSAHVAAAAVLVWVTLPEDVPVQQPPETQLQLTAFEVPRSDAQETRPDAQGLDSGDTGGTRMDQNALTTSRGEAQSLESARVVADSNSGQPAQTAALPTETTTAQAATAEPTVAVTVDSAPIQAVSANAEAILAQPSQTDPVPELAAPTESATSLSPGATDARIVVATAASLVAEPPLANPVAPIITAALSVTQTPPPSEPAALPPVQPATAATIVPEVPAASSSDPPATEITGADAPSQTASTLPPPAIRSKATLAFSGGGNGPVDPVSLSAFQSFMAPDDLGAEAAELRDGISSALSAVPCSRLQMRYDPEDNTVILTGHVPEANLRAEVLAMMQDQMGADIPVRQDLLILPRPQCGALSGISQVGLPQSTDQITNPLLLGQSTHAREFAYVDGQALVLDLQGADYDAYVYVDFFDAGGNVLHLSPNEFTPIQRTPAKSALKIGSDRPLSPGEPGLHITIGPPYGQEIAVAFAASEPLYDGVRPLVEPAEPYLEWLRARVSEARSRSPDFKGEWVYFFVTTAAK